MAERGCYPLHGRDRIVFAMSAREDLIRRRPERGSYSRMSGGRIVLYWGVELTSVVELRMKRSLFSVLESLSVVRLHRVQHHPKNGPKYEILDLMETFVNNPYG